MKTHRTIAKKDKLHALIVLAVAAIVLACGLWGLRTWQDRQLEQTSTPETEHRKTLDYQGKTYVAREGVETYLFMGIDVEGPAKGNKGYIGGGQADVQLLLVVDRFNRTWQVLEINRDSMVDVPVLGVNGAEVSSEYQQIALAHSYGNGLQNSCENNVKAVSQLFNHQNINGYLALNMDGISILNDAVGGVEVTMLDDFSQTDASMAKGATVKLNGTQAMTYVRGRQGVGDETNLSRMARQEQYLNALFAKVSGMSAENATQAYQAVEGYVVTNMANQWLKLLDRLETYQKLDPLTIDGESYLDSQGAAAYRLDEDSLNQVMIQLFYEPQS